MRLTPARVVAIAILGGLAAAGTVELLRTRPAVEVAAEPAPARAADDPPDQDATTSGNLPASESDPRHAARLAELEERVARLEEALRSSRQPVEDDPVRDRAALHDFVLDVMAEEREARRRQAEEEALAEEEQQLAFDTRMQVAALTEELGLADWEKERLVEILMEVEKLRKELLESVDPLTSSPEDLERQMKELDALLRRRVEEELGADRAFSLLGE